MDNERVLDSVQELKPPPSLERIAAFIDEVTHTSAFESLTDEAPTAIGTAGAHAQDFASEILGRASLGGLLPIQNERNALAAKYSIQSRDVRDFAQWLVKYRDEKSDSENVVHVRVVERVVPGPERVVARDLTQSEIEALIQESGRSSRVNQSESVNRDSSGLRPLDADVPEPRRLSEELKAVGNAKDYKGPTPEEAKEAVGFLNRTVWGSNLSFGSFLGGLVAGQAAAVGSPAMALLPQSVGSAGLGAPGVGYLLHGMGFGLPGAGGMAAYHGMPGALGAVVANPFSGGQPLGAGILPPAVFATAPGPTAMGLSPIPYGEIAGSMNFNPALAPTPSLGQITLVAPPLAVASEQSELSGTAVQFDWPTLAKGIGTVDPAGLVTLKNALPAGASFIYPAISPSQLPLGAVNLNISPSVSRELLAGGYGIDDAPLATQSSLMAAALSGMPGSTALAGSIIPLSPPKTVSAGILPDHRSTPTGALADAGGVARRGGALDFLGLPVRLAPVLGKTSEVRQEHDIRASLADPSLPKVIRPEQFAPMQNRLFSAFHSVDAEPDKNAWQRAAPTFGLRDAEPATLLSPDARIKMPAHGAPLPQIEGSSDPIGRSIGRAARASEAIKNTHAPTTPSGLPTSGAITPSSGFKVPDSTMSIPSTTPQRRVGMPVGKPSSDPDLASANSSASPPLGGSAMQSFVRGAPSPVMPGVSMPSSSWNSPGKSSSLPLIGESGGTAGNPSLMGSGVGAMGRGISTPNVPPHLPLLASTQSAPLARPGWSGGFGYSTPAGSTTSGSQAPPIPSSITPALQHQPHYRSAPISNRSTGAASPSHESSSVPTSSFSHRSSDLTHVSPPSIHERAPSPPDLPKAAIGLPPLGLRTPPSPIIISPRLPAVAANMPLRRAPTSPAASSPGSGLAIQASHSRLHEPAGGGLADAKSEASRSNEVGNAATDVNLVAREVWSLLKQRIAHESERHGLR